MQFGGGEILKRLMAGATMLLAIVLFVPAASAHPRGVGVVSHPTEAAVQTEVEQFSLPGRPRADCDESSACCLLGQCSQIATVLSAEVTAPQAGRGMSRTYGLVSTAMSHNRQAGPATPPPKLDA